MKKKLLKNLILTFAIIAFSSQITAQVVNNIETFSSGLNGWDVAFGTQSTVTHAATEGINGDGALQLARTGNNANFGIKPVTGINATNKKAIRIVYKNGTKADQFRIGGKNDDGTALKNNSGGNIDINGVLTAESGEYVTSYIDMSSYTLWKGELTDLFIMVRKNTPDTGDFFLDEIEFLDEMPAITYNEFIQNPSFDGPSGIAHLSGASAGASRAITSTESHDGTQSLRYTYSADATGNFWAFSNYEKIYSSVYTAGSDLQFKMWVKTNRAAPITMQVRLKLSNGGTEVTEKPISSVTTTNTAMEWEELTFNIEVRDDFDGATFWFNVFWVDEAGGAVDENLNAGDIVYVDQLSATLTLDNVLSVEKNILEDVHLFVNQNAKTLNISASAKSSFMLYNILGKAVKSENNLKESNIISVADLSSGIYIAKISSEGKSYTRKIIID